MCTSSPPDQTPEVLRANENTQKIIQSNCIRCHERPWKRS